MPNTHRLSSGRKQQVSISASTKTIPRLDTCIVYAKSILIYSSNSAIQTSRRKGGIYGQTEIIWEHLKDRSSGHFCGHVHCQIHRQHRKIKDCRCITLLQCSTLQEEKHQASWKKIRWWTRSGKDWKRTERRIQMGAFHREAPFCIPIELFDGKKFKEKEMLQIEVLY